MRDERFTRDRQCEACGELADGDCACTITILSPYPWPGRFDGSRAERIPVIPPAAAPAPRRSFNLRVAEWGRVERIECIEERDRTAFATLPVEQLPAYAAWRAAQNRAAR
jgi:hypothetical protein